MWDFAFLSRHSVGDSFSDYDKTLDEAVERGYNTIRIDPLPQTIDLTQPEIICCGPKLTNQPFNPWDQPKGFEGPCGLWLLEFMEKLLSRNLHYILSAWNKPIAPGDSLSDLETMTARWQIMLREWKKRFDFGNCIFVDLSNEFPYFLEGYMESSSEGMPMWSDGWKEKIRNEVNGCLRTLRNEFPELRFTISLHGDPRWIDVGLELDCMDIHFYADADQRFSDRTNFDRISSQLLQNENLYADFSRRCVASHSAMAPMYRARQRSRLSQFASWAADAGIPLTTSESWSSWFYIDHPDMDWAWLLEWSEWTVEDALDFQMWGYTPHNYLQPQFANWKDVAWHRGLTNRFLESRRPG